MASVTPKLGLVGATSFVVGTIIGSGIFITSNAMLSSVGSWGASLLVWALSGVAAGLGALTWADLTARIPKQGGTYIFIKEGLGDFPSFLYIITRVFLLNPAVQAVIALGSSQYLLAPFQACVTPSITLSTVAISIVLLITFLHCISTSLVTHLNSFLTCIKLLLLAIILICALVHLPYSTNFLPPPFQGTSVDVTGWVAAMQFGYFSFSGWQGLPAFIEDIHNPTVTFPLAVVLGLGIVTVAYIGTNIAFLLVLSLDQIKSSSSVGFSFANLLGGVGLSAPLSLLVFLSMLGTSLGIGMFAGRFCFAASREHHLPFFLSYLQMDNNTPIPAQMLHALLAIAMLCFTTRIYLVLKIFVMVTIGFDLLVVVSLLRLKYRFPDVKQDFKVNVCIPCLYGLVLIFMLGVLVIKDPDILLLVAAGFLVIIALIYLIVFHLKLVQLNCLSLSSVNRILSKLFLLIPAKREP